MALAPLSQTIFLTEDGSIPTGQQPVVIPPLLYEEPTIVTPAAINSDGSPQVGELLTGIDPSFSDATITRRRWFFNSAVVATISTYRPEIEGDYTWVVDGVANDGETPISSSSSIRVATATTQITITGTPPTTGRAGVDYSFIPTTSNGSGAKVFAKNRTLLAGQTFDQSTGAIGGKPTEAGTINGLIISVTDDTGTASTTATTVTIAAASAAPTAANTLGTSSLLVTQVDGAQAAFAPIITALGL